MKDRSILKSQDTIEFVPLRRTDPSAMELTAGFSSDSVD